MPNLHLRVAKQQKNDEFYTLYSTIAKEVKHYVSYFAGKKVLCNCDGLDSFFWRYFHEQFSNLKLKSLVCIPYYPHDLDTFCYEYLGGDDSNWLTCNGHRLSCNGDFRDSECIEITKKADVIVTNPPFSLFREYLTLLMELGKDYVVLGNQNAITTKQIFPYVKEGRLWYGVSIHSGGVDFRIPDDWAEYSDNVFVKGGCHYINLSGVRWFTNIKADGIQQVFVPKSYYKGNESLYPVCENYNMINVNAVKDIPCDYPGAMGVPVTFLDKYDPAQFEILGITASWDESPEVKAIKTSATKRHNPVLHGKELYRRLIIRNRHPV